MRARHLLTLNLLACTCLALGATSAWAADPTPAKPAQPTKEMREKMAALHEQMATCLRSDKPIADCRGEMMKSCHDDLGTNCPMMMGMQRPRHMMNSPAPTPK